MPVKRIEFIEFHFEIKTLSLKDRQKLKAFILSIFKKEGTLVSSVNYIFCSDRQLLKINQDFLRHDYYTDILTFELAKKGAPVKGEVYVSVDRVRDNARILNQFYYQELHRVIFHGALHLCGYRDKSKKEKIAMRAKEDLYLLRYFK